MTLELESFVELATGSFSSAFGILNLSFLAIKGSHALFFSSFFC